MTDTAVLMLNQEALTPAPQATGNKAFLGAKNPEKSAFSEVFNQHVQKTERPAARAERNEKAAESSGKNLPKNGKPAAESGRSEAQARAPRDKEPVKADDAKTAKSANAPSTETPKADTTGKPEAPRAEAAESTTVVEHDAAAASPVDGDMAESDQGAALDLTELLAELTATDAEPAAIDDALLTASPISDQTAVDTSLVWDDVLQPAVAAETELPADILPLNGLKMAMDALNSRAPVTTAPGEGLMLRSAMHDDPASLARGQYLSALMGEMLPESGGDTGTDLTGRRQGQGASLLNSLFMNRLSHDAFASMPVASSDTASVLGSEDGADFSTVMNTLRPASTVAATTVPVIPVPTHAGHSAWAGAMGERVMWLAQNDMREAQLQLNPKHLGAVDVRISYHNDQVTVSFVTQNAAAKDALDSAMPRLRDMFSEQGLNLGDVNVAHDSNYGRDRQQYGKGSGGALHNNSDTDALMLEAEMPLRAIGHGMLDLHA